jgi:hypothetical protein
LQLDNELLKAKSVTVYEQPKKGKMPAWQNLTIQFIMPIKTGF